MHRSAHDLMKRLLGSIELTTWKFTTVLDVGSRNVNGTNRDLLPSAAYVGIDIIAGRDVDIVVNDPYDWPELPDNYYDFAISTQTFEHIAHPWKTAALMAQKARPGGHIIVIAPSRGRQHDYPNDYYRFWGAGLLALFDGAVEPIEFGEGGGHWGDAYLLAVKPV